MKDFDFEQYYRSNCAGRFRSVAVALALLATSGTIWAHHSTAGVFAMDEWLEIEGVVSELSLANPHSSIGIDVSDENGQVTTWSVETGNVAALRRANWNAETLPVGTRVLVGGAPSGRGLPQLLLGQFVLLDTGTIIKGVGVSAPVPEHATGGNDAPEVIGATTSGTYAASTAQYVDRSGVYEGNHPLQKYLTGNWVGGMPGRGPNLSGDWRQAVTDALTDAGREYVDNYQTSDDPSTHCEAPGHMHITHMFHPIEIVDLGDRVYFLASFMGAVWRAFDEEQPPLDFANRYGRSHYWWEGDTLVVRTEQMTAQVIWPPMGLGYSGTEEGYFEQRFTLTDDRNQYLYEQTIYDPVYYKEPVIWKAMRTRTDERLVVDDCIFTDYE